MHHSHGECRDCALNEITEEHACAEGEGDGSLAWWVAAHWPYYHRELEGSGYSPQPDMPIVFERFEVVHPPSRGTRPNNSSKPTPLRGAA